MAWRVRPFSCLAKALQAQQPEPLALLEPEAAVVMVAESLVFHAAHAPPNPRLQFPQNLPAGEPASSELLSGALNDSVEFRHHFTVAVVRTSGSLWNFLPDCAL